MVGSRPAKKYHESESAFCASPITCNATQFAVLDRVEVVGHETRNVGADAVANEVQVVGADAAGVVGEVVDQLGDALGAEAGRPFHLL